MGMWGYYYNQNDAAGDWYDGRGGYVNHRLAFIKKTLQERDIEYNSEEYRAASAALVNLVNEIKEDDDYCPSKYPKVFEAIDMAIDCYDQMLSHDSSVSDAREYNERLMEDRQALVAAKSVDGPKVKFKAGGGLACALGIDEQGKLPASKVSGKSRLKSARPSHSKRVKEKK